MPARYATWAALAGMLTASGCEGAPEKAGRHGQPEAAVSPRARPTLAASLSWSAANCTVPDAPTQLIGHSVDMLTTAFGRPIADARFILSDALTPARNTLLNRLPLRGNERVVVREMIWTKARCDLTVWLTQRGGVWRAIQTARASADAEY